MSVNENREETSETRQQWEVEVVNIQYKIALMARNSRCYMRDCDPIDVFNYLINFI